MERRNNGSLISPAAATALLPAAAEAHPERAADAAADITAATAALTKESLKNCADIDKAVAVLTATSPAYPSIKMLKKQRLLLGLFSASQLQANEEIFRI